MSNLCGAWALSGGPIEKYLSESDKNAMLAHLSTGPRDVRQFSRGPCWMAAAAENMAHDGGACLAMEGALVFEEDGPRSLAEFFARQKSEPVFGIFLDGHYALAYADAVRNILILLRDPSGGESLFYVRTKDLLLFSASANPLLAHSRVPRTLDPEAATEFLLNGSLVFGARTLFSGIAQVLPGHLLESSRDGIKRRLHWKGLLEPSEENPIDTPLKLRESLVHAVKLAVGEDKQAAISLSGGADSATIAACAVELLGAQNVTAFTHEFSDSSQPSEAPDARRFCRRLGIRHRTIKITYPECLDAVAETAWRMENPRCVPRVVPIPILARKVKEAGFAKFLDGRCMEQILGVLYSENLGKAAQVLPWVPRPDLLLRYWRLAIAPRKHWRMLARVMARGIHSGLKPPPPDLYYLLLCVLQHNEIIKDVAVFYPPGLRELVRRTVNSSHVGEAIAAIRDLPLSVQLQYLNYSYRTHLTLFRGKPLARAAGAALVSPAAFLLPARLSRHLWRRPGPGRVLLQEAMKDRVPEAIWNRPKDWALTSIPESWLSDIMRFFAPLTARSRADLRARYFTGFDSLCRHFDESAAPPAMGWTTFGHRSMDSLAVWHRVHIELPLRTAPPNLEDMR